ncbi:MAG: Gfo/Idh/MocA family protein [Sphaerochaeta sp.]|uniref:Gfo/Idh/MocA family protein n=1 Tax=Sphaerochaeta sp. TaxID=1972642 RepID=UPI003D10CB67
MKLVMIGCGGMGTYQAKKFRELGFEIVGAIDRNAEHRTSFCKIYGVRRSYPHYRDLAQFVGEADAVSCCLPDNKHVECCLFAIEQGFAVFCEKPLAKDAHQANQLATIRVERPFMINFSKRNMASLAALQTLLADQALGDIRHIDISYRQSWAHSHVWGDPETTFRWKWRLLEEYNSQGCLTDLGSHLIDILVYLFGSVKHPSNIQKTYENGALVDYRSELVVGESIGCTFHCSYIDETWDDRIYLSVNGARSTAELDTAQDRNAITLIQKGERRCITGDNVRSTYERFAAAVALGITETPSLADGLRVQTILEELAT